MSVIKQLREIHDLNNATKEAFDRLPSAVCYFTPDGAIKLCNSVMYDIYRRIAGKDLQSYEELRTALDGCNGCEEVIRDGNIFLFPEDTAWQYSEQMVQTENCRPYRETVFSDVTELYRKRRELERQSKEMKQMYADLIELSGQLLEITREQEILNMKGRLHDQMNMGLTAIRQILQQNTISEESASAIAQFRRATQILQEDNSCLQNDLTEFIRDAKVAGVHVHISGKLPQEGETLQLLIAVMREACVNAARHADASELYIMTEMTADTVTLQITNDGRPPAGKMIAKGGLVDLGKQIEKIGGTLKIRSLPRFVLTVQVPFDGQNQGKEIFE